MGRSVKLQSCKQRNYREIGLSIKMKKRANKRLDGPEKCSRKAKASKEESVICKQNDFLQSY